MSIQREFELVNTILTEFISQLSDEEYTSLLAGKSYLKLEQSREKLSKDKMEDILLETSKSMEYLNNANITRDELMDILDYIEISYKKRYSKDELINLVLLFIENNKQSFNDKIIQESSDVQRLNEVYKKLVDSLDINEAKSILQDKSNIKNRKELVELGTMLHVNFGKELSFDKACKKIVDDVVASKIRSYKIRNKI